MRAANWTFTPVSEQPFLAHAEEGWDSGRIEPGAANVTSAMVLGDGTWLLYFHTWPSKRAVLGEGFIGRATAPPGPLDGRSRSGLKDE